MSGLVGEENHRLNNCTNDNHEPVIENQDRRNSDPIIEQKHVLHSQDYGNDVLVKLNALRTEKSFTDATLCIGDKEFPCHRNVLAVSSPYFKAMFTSDLRESKQAKIVINEISSSTMCSIIDYAYTGRIEISVDNAQELLAAGSLFHYPAIVEACCDFLSGQLHPSNCLGIESFAQIHSCSKLEMEAHQFALENFSAVVEYDEFVDLPLERLVTYLASDLIDIRTEETAYDAALRWVHHDLGSRKEHISSVLPHIRLTTVDVTYLTTVIRNDPLVQGSEQCRTLVEDAWRYHESRTDQTAQRRRSIKSDATIPRPSTMAKEVMVLIGGNNNIANTSIPSVEMYDPCKDKWHELPDLPVNLVWFSVTAVDNDIIVTGGMVDNKIVSRVWKFAALHRRWSEMKSMLSPRAQHTSAAINGKLYILGGVQMIGENKWAAVERLDCYDLEKDEWFEAGMSPMPRKFSCAVPYKKNIVELGGTQSGARVKTMESHLCDDAGHLTYAREQFVLPESIQFSQIVVLNGIFYIIWEDSKKLISLNPEKRTFKWLPDMHYAHVHSGATVINGKIYIAGGQMDGKPSRVVESYDPVANTWTLVKSMRQARACHGCVTIQMN